MRPRQLIVIAAVTMIVTGLVVRQLRGHHAATDPERIRIVTEVYGGAATASEITAALRAVRVLAKRPFPGGYDRDCGSGHRCSFGTAWSDATTAPDGHNGCDTRNDVLREQLVAVRVDPASHGCKISAGTLVDPYTGRLVDFASDHYDIDIDHVVPLAYAWDMGAAAWTQPQRERFANDTSGELLASWGPANQDKRDFGPPSWLPPNATFRCDYVLRFVQVIARYGLAITTADEHAARDTAHRC